MYLSSGACLSPPEEVSVMGSPVSDKHWHMWVHTQVFMLEARAKKQVLRSVKKVVVFPMAPSTATSISVHLVPKGRSSSSCRDKPWLLHTHVATSLLRGDPASLQHKCKTSPRLWCWKPGLNPREAALKGQSDCRSWRQCAYLSSVFRPMHGESFRANTTLCH